MSGYQEAVTDPSSLGQILVMTYPLVGNYGTNEADQESDSIQCAGLIVSELCEAPCNWKSTRTLGAYLAGRGVPVLTGMDTRAIARYIAKHGAMPGMIVEDSDGAENGKTSEETESRMNDSAENASNLALLAEWKLHNPAKKATCVHKYTIPGTGPRIAVLDLGTRRSAMAGLIRHGCELTVYPADTGAEEILRGDPNGVMLTGGPGSPDQDEALIATTRILCERVPVMGIGLGMLMIARAYGASVYKLPYGHHGSNCPVRDVERRTCLITLQHDAYAIAKEGLPSCVRVTQENLNDQTLAGIAVAGTRAFGVNYHPESGATLRGVRTVYDRFLSMMPDKEGKMHA